MFWQRLLISTMAPCLSYAWTLPSRRQDISIYTTFLIDDACDKAVVLKAHADAVMMAGAALDIEHDELSTLSRYTINWNGATTIDYFGSPSSNNAYREHILRTIILSSQAYRGWGISDWWNNRYVTITCENNVDECEGSPAYTSNKYNYPRVNYCPSFFEILRSHESMWNDIKSGPADRKHNICNLRSQATTALHELLHINSKFTSNICDGGCKDTTQTLDNDREVVPTYKAGRAKLLARRDAGKAADTNDNYAYWVMSRWMEKQTGIYPRYPLVWDPTKSFAENQRRENDQPGTPESLSFDMEDSFNGEGGGSIITAELASADTYPDWYKPILDAMMNGTVDSDVHQPPYSGTAPRDPPPDAITCETTESSPLYFDCVHSFVFNDFRSNKAHKGRKGEDYWEAYVMTCAINVHCHEDWTEDCTATKGDILDHAASIFHKCTNGQAGPSGRCGGRVPFTIPNCPGDVQIIHTPVEG